MGNIKLPFGCEVTACTGRVVREEDTGKLGAATSSRGNPQTSRHRLRHEDGDSAEPQRERASLAGTPRKPKEPARGRVRIPRQTRGNISHISHLGEYRTAHRQWVSEASKGLQLTLQSSELVAIEKRKDKLSEKCGEIMAGGHPAGSQVACRSLQLQAAFQDKGPAGGVPVAPVLSPQGK